MAAARLQLVIIVVYVVVVVSSCHVVVDAVDNGQKSILQGHAQEFSLGAKTKWLKIKAKCREWRGVLGGQQAPSPPAMGLRECCELPSAVRGRAPTAQRFSPFSALRVASPDTVILLIIVDYHAAIGRCGGKTPMPPPAYIPAITCASLCIIRHDVLCE